MPTAIIDSVAVVYARALFELAEAAGGRAKLEEIADELETILDLVRGDARFREFVASPIIDQGRRADSIRAIFNGRITDLLLRFLLVLNHKDRLGHVESIARAYDRLIQEAFGRVEVDVWTAAPVEADQLQRIVDLVRKAIGREPVVHRYVDPDMLGGIRLKIGDALVDASVAGRLDRMHESILRGGGVLRDRLGRIVVE